MIRNDTLICGNVVLPEMANINHSCTQGAGTTPPASLILDMKSTSNPRHKNGNRRRKMRDRFKAMGLPCAICGREIHYDEPSDAQHPWSFVIDEKAPVSRWQEFGYASPTQAALDWNNVQPVHYRCNALKGARTMEELRASKRSCVNLPDGNW